MKIPGTRASTSSNGMRGANESAEKPDTQPQILSQRLATGSTVSRQQHVEKFWELQNFIGFIRLSIHHFQELSAPIHTLAQSLSKSPPTEKA